jgi:hypothetical protein
MDDGSRRCGSITVNDGRTRSGTRTDGGSPPLAAPDKPAGVMLSLGASLRRCWRRSSAGRGGAKAWASKQPTKTLLKYFQDYAPSSEPPNDPATYAQIVADTISARLGSAKVTTGTTIGEILALGPTAMDDFVSGQEKAEGFTQSNVKLVAKDSGDLPKEVRDFVAGFDAATGNTNAAADAVAAAP